MEHQYSDRIVRLLQLYLLGDITEEERQELEDWCEEAPRNRKLFEQICQEDLGTGGNMQPCCYSLF